MKIKDILIKKQKVTEQPTEITKSVAISPFDILKILGTDSYEEISNIDKRRNFFIINRMISRTLPQVCLSLSHFKSNSDIGVDYWHNAFKELSKSSNGRNVLALIRKNMWIKMTIDKKATVIYDKDLAEEYMKLANITKSDFDTLIRFYKTETIDYLKEVENMMKTNNK